MLTDRCIRGVGGSSHGSATNHATSSPIIIVKLTVRSPQKRSLALVSILQHLAAAEIAIALRLRDFRSPAIFEFFNTIRHERSSIP